MYAVVKFIPYIPFGFSAVFLKRIFSAVFSGGLKMLPSVDLKTEPD